MTTNNHPAQGPVSLERLHQIRKILIHAAAQSDGGNLGYAMTDAVKVINGVITAFGAEPVAYMYKDGDDIEYNGHNEFSGGGKGAPLYTAPTAPVIPDGWIPVSERMPNDKDFVWCYGYVSGWTESDGFEAYYDATRNKWWTVDDEKVGKITHWMPLPNPPKE